MLQASRILWIPAPEYGSQISTTKSPAAEEVITHFINRGFGKSRIRTVKLIFQQMVLCPLEVPIGTEGALQIDRKIDHVLFPIPGVFTQHLDGGLDCSTGTKKQDGEKDQGQDSEQSGPFASVIASKVIGFS